MQQSFPRHISALPRIFEFLGRSLEPLGVERRERLEVELIIEELFTNLVKYNKGGKHDIPITLERRDRKLWIVLTDTDVDEFDVTRVPAVDTDEPLAHRKPGGLGLHLVRKMTESVSYEYERRTSRITVVKPLESWHV